MTIGSVEFIELARNRIVPLFALALFGFGTFIFLDQDSTDARFAVSLFVMLSGLLILAIHHFKGYEYSHIGLLFIVAILVYASAYSFQSAYTYAGISMVIMFSVVFENKIVTHILSIVSILGLFVFAYLGIFTLRPVFIQPDNIALVNNIEMALISITVTYIVSIYIHNTLYAAIRMQREQYKKLEKAQDHLIQQTRQETLETISAGIAHDFNNTLQILMSFIHVATSDKRMPEDCVKIFNRMNNIVNNARQLSKQLVNMVRNSDAKYAKIDNLKGLIEDTASYTMLGSSKVHFEIEPDLVAISGNRLQLIQVLQNLVLNAKQASKDDIDIIVKAVNLTLVKKNSFQLDPGNYVSIHVIDQGIGIPQEIQNKIFELFFTTKEEGSGIGLALSKKIIEQHRGHIDFKDNPSGGSDFYIVLPEIDT